MANCWKLIVLSQLAAFAAIGLLLLAVYHDVYPSGDQDLPPLERLWFGAGERPQEEEEDATIKPFRINIQDRELEDVNARVENDVRRLKGSHPSPIFDSFGYGTNVNFVTDDVADYWIRKYDWRKQEKALNAMGTHHLTSIDGLQVHFVVARPDPKLLTKGKRVLPLLISHGWPGSFAEFAKLVPLLTTPKPDADFVFEVVMPSIPGFGFSSAPRKPGFHVGQCARIFKTLMGRLGHDKFYTQGGDFGSSITQSIAALYPDSVLGTHLNLVFPSAAPAWTLRSLAVLLFPGLFLEKEELEHLTPLSDQIRGLVYKTGYLHIQATFPDTIGIALHSSPLGLAAYILEKFAGGTRASNRDHPKGNLLETFTMDELITDVLIYWFSGTITSSMRFYRENFGNATNFKVASAIGRRRMHTPVGLAMAAHEMISPSRLEMEAKFKNIVTHTVMPEVGHFAALEAPQKLSDDFWKFARIVEKRKGSESKPRNEL